MATTTNYGWTTPDDTALVKDGASAIRTLGTSVDTTTKNLNPETTLGDISFRSSTSNVNTRLGIGGTGTVLTVASGVPSWATPSSGSRTLLSTTSLTGSSVTVSSISQDYTDLYITLTDYYASVDQTDNILMRFNGITTASYYGFISSMGSNYSQGYTVSSIPVAYALRNVSAEAFGEITIPNYTNTVIRKTADIFSNGINAYNTANAGGSFGRGISKLTAAVTSLTFFLSGNNYSGGTLRIYGVK